MKKSLVIVGIFVVLISLSFVSAAWPFTGNAIKGVGNKVGGSGSSVYDDWAETDNGDDDEVAGIVAYTSFRKWRWRADYCANDNNLKEYRLEDRSGNRKVLRSRTVFCSNGCSEVTPQPLTAGHPGFDTEDYEEMANAVSGQCNGPPAATDCDFTDGGTGVRVTYDDGTHDDFLDRCTRSTGNGDGDYLTTFRCNDGNEAVRTTDDESCGFGQCVVDGDGARCLDARGTGLDVASVCEETDDRIDFDTEGTTTAGPYTGTDFCLSNKRLLEFYCPLDPDQERIVATTRVCSANDVCRDGACLIRLSS